SASSRPVNGILAGPASGGTLSALPAISVSAAAAAALAGIASALPAACARTPDRLPRSAALLAARGFAPRVPSPRELPPVDPLAPCAGAAARVGAAAGAAEDGAGAGGVREGAATDGAF